MITSPYEKYKQSSVQTSTPGQLVIMLYDGAIRFVKVGIEGISSKDYMKANVNLGKAQTIISELMSTLDHSYPVSKNLFSMYEYMNHLLIQSNIKKETKHALEALDYLKELRETWVAASKSTIRDISE
ncbi:flagellar export chaperone FliS [Paenibacillus taichungensis]|uniref:Flagellar secretion chaperone FliS n=1 Tax=Paenibacillus taichungensis TaxID=484184 RepID=A0A329QE50_9BACL|nr:flagellar export chaperone FliS [Paenibacillus taichungensis]RAW09969.1 flagellar export chaperone FliS [Paenibacillus taichungensis]